MGDYITFVLEKKLEKTEVYNVVNAKKKDVIGKILWYSHWRQYCFLPNLDIVLSAGCLTDIALFIECLMKRYECLK